MSSEPKHMTAVVNDLTWHWVEQGEGPAVVLLHGIPESWRCWEKQMPVLSQQFRVLALDLKGYGQSDKAEGDYSGTNVAREVVDLLDSLGIESFHLAGHDWGVMIGDNVCNLVSDRVERYVRCCLSLHNYDARNSLHHQWNGINPEKATVLMSNAEAYVRTWFQRSARSPLNLRTRALQKRCRVTSATFARANPSTTRGSPCRCSISTANMTHDSPSSTRVAWKNTCRDLKRFWFWIPVTL